MEHRRELAGFLKSRRDRLSPGDVGLPPGQRRRTPGLRREEVAERAGLSVDYYVRLEQARDVSPSAHTLEALAEALRLEDDERRHLFELARQGVPARPGRRPELVRSSLRRLVETMSPIPACVLNRRMDVLCWNDAMPALFTDFEQLPLAQRNMIRLTFLDPATRLLYPDWDVVAREAVASLRAASARLPEDPLLTQLIGELTVKSVEFARWWTLHDVKEKRSGHKRLIHPRVGLLELDFEVLTVPDSSDQLLVTYLASDATTQARLVQLLSGEVDDRGALRVLQT
jgi:transcriptional regulator with XRE-family HTH domain